jgi:hypothetical protein
MFISKDDKEIKWLWYDGKMHTVKIVSDADILNIKELHDSVAKITADKEDMCKKIWWLGIALTGSTDGGWGFLMGWLLRSIKKDKVWNITHDEEEVPEDEASEHLASLYEEVAKMIRDRKGQGQGMPKISSPTTGSPDVTELFK